MGMFDFLGSSGSSGGSGWAGNVIGGLGTAAMIYGLYQQNKQQQSQQSYNQNFNADQLAEQKREFDAKYGLEQQTAEQQAAAAEAAAAAQQAAVAAQVQAAHSHAIQGAYDSMIRAVESGKGGEAAILSSLIDRVQRAYAQRSAATA